MASAQPSGFGGRQGSSRAAGQNCGEFAGVWGVIGESESVCRGIGTFGMGKCLGKAERGSRRERCSTQASSGGQQRRGHFRRRAFSAGKRNRRRFVIYRAIGRIFCHGDVQGGLHQRHGELSGCPQRGTGFQGISGGKGQ